MISRQWVITIVCIVVFAGLLYGFMPEKKLVEGAQAKLAPLSVMVEEEGQTRVIDRYDISSPVSGQLQRVMYIVGDLVKKNQVVALVKPTPSPVLDVRAKASATDQINAAEAQLRASEEAIKTASAQLSLAQSEASRYEHVFKAGGVSAEKYDQIRTDLRRAEAENRSAQFRKDVAQHQLEMAQTALKYSAQTGLNPKDNVEIVSSVNGRILKIFQKSESVISAGQPIIELGDPAALEIAVDVLSEDAVKLHRGTKVKIVRWGGPKDLDAVVKTVEPAGFTKVSALGVEEQRANIILEITSPYDEWKTLGDGYRVNAEFIIWHGENILQVPTSALFKEGRNWFTFLVKRNKVVKQAIKIGHQGGLNTEILEGIHPGDWVITHPDDTIEAGIGVRIHPYPERS
jgi:HlyD family secretion protein